MLLDRDYVFVSLVDEWFLRTRSYEVVDTDRDSGFRRIQEPECFEIVKHLDGHLMTKPDVRVVNERLQAFFLQGAVDEWQSCGNRIVEDHATNCGVNNATNIVLNNRAENVLRIVFLDEIDQIALYTKLDWSLGCYFIRVECEQHFFE